MPHSQLSNGSPTAVSVEAAAFRRHGLGRKLINGYIRVMNWISGYAAVAAALLLFSGAVSICHMIVMRSILGANTIWQTEYATYSITGAMLLGSPYVLLCGGHVAVTVVLEVANETIRNIMQFCSSLVGLAFCAALAYASWHHLIEAYSRGWGTGTVWNPPLWLAIAPITIGATLLTLQYVAELLPKED